MSDDPTDNTSEESSDGGPSGDSADEGRQCVNCGASLNRYSKFCSECGTEQSPAGDNDQSQQDSGWQQGGQSGQQDSGWQQGGQSGQRDSGWQQGGQSGQQDSGWQEGGQSGQQDSGWQEGGQSGQQDREWQQGGQSGQQDSGWQEGGQSGQGRRGQQRGPGGQQRGGQQYGHSRGPDRIETAGPNSETGLAALTHLLALFTGIIGPVIVYAVTDDPFLKANAANATDWQIMLIVYSFSSFILTFIFAFIFPPLALIAVLVFILLIFGNFIFVVVATIKAANGEAWSYPITPDLL